MPQNELIELIIKVVKAEMGQWRESMTYYEIEAFVGCVIAELLKAEVITKWEESVMRQKLVDQ